ncbi:MAG: UDP-N-acetylmuramoyl-L-alanyl-D-glutamate--2,6-diaminopimelate ligase [Betaproteobacteria bacterium]|nr:UDP-N-acetylmuramoyl-L-alanyl-D-glutamate--2,6-diaminopimelate ligase [Betaproteobacteria bacterium]
MDLFGQLAAQGAVIRALASDSRRVAPGTAFFAWPGEAGDGRRHIPDALARGASAVVWEAADFAWNAAWGVPNVGVRNLKRMAGPLASDYFKRPSQALWMCGVTGTNGKTSCTQWIAAALEAHGVSSGVIGTLGAGLSGRLSATGNTTPDALEVQRLLAELRDAGAGAVAMEVSSHGLEQGRVNGVEFDCALFTNLSHDHLDYHGSMEAYAAAKSRLFDTATLAHAVLNMDDVLGVQIAQKLARRGLPVTGYSLSASGIAPGSVTARIAAREIRIGAAGTAMSLSTSWGEREAHIRQIGRFNVANALGVLGCLLAWGMDIDSALGQLSRLPDVPGRMQTLGGGTRPLVVIDYAHTPDALEKVLLTLRPVAEAGGGRLVAVFGAGGDRDPSKRGLMGEIASRLADRVVLTSDNPRSEDPLAIIEAIRRGVSVEHEVQPDRSMAIACALRAAVQGDVVLLAGKGHETWQEIAGRRLPFSDSVVAEQTLSAWGTA